MPEKERHRHHLSGGSSQVLALALLGVSAARDQSHAWLWEGLGPLPPPSGPVPHAQFEYTVDAELLNEHPRQTAVDYFVDDPAALVCVECKWMEARLGGCSCGSDAALVGDCSDRVLERTRYWDVARDVFGLSDRELGKPCPLSFTDQAVRNVAAAHALARLSSSPCSGSSTTPPTPTSLAAVIGQDGRTRCRQP